MKRTNMIVACLAFLFLGIAVVLSNCGGGGGSGNNNTSLSSAKAIKAFSFTSPAATGTIDENAYICVVTVPYGTNVTALVATFTTTGMSVKVGTTVQVSGVTPNDFTNPVLYVVTAADGSTETYTVMVAIAPISAKSITAFSLLGNVGTINESAKTISVAVPYGTSVTALVATFATTGVSVKVGGYTQVSGTTPNDFTNPVLYVVTAADSSTTTYTVTVTITPSSAKSITAYSLLGIAGTINESAKTISVTVPYGTNVTALVATFTTTDPNVKVSGLLQVSGVTPNDFTNPVYYVVGSLGRGGVTYSVTVTVAAPNSGKAITAYSLLGRTGMIYESGAKLISVTAPFGTDVTALVATFATTGVNVKVGTTLQVSGVTPNDFTNPVSYDVMAADGSTATYIVVVTVATVSAKAIKIFGFTNPWAMGIINEAAKSIAVTMPYGTNVTALVATFFTSSSSVKVGGTSQISGVTPNDFTNPVLYVVTAADGSAVTYTVTVTVAAVSAKAITLLSISGASALGTINETAKTIFVTMPYGTNVTALVATFITTGANVKVSGTTQVSGMTPNDFTNPVLYVVTAADGSAATYTVTVAFPVNVTLLAGSLGVYGSEDGTGTAARFFYPTGITTDGTNLYVLDNQTIRKIVIATGEVTTLAGSAGSWGSADGTGSAARFWSPDGITTDGTNLYVADTSNSKIRKIVIATGAVTTFAGSGIFGSADGTGAAAQFGFPYDITTDGTNLYVADTINNKIRKIVIATGAVTTFAGSGSFGSTDGTGTAAQFGLPSGITTDGTNLYVADTSNNTIRKIVIATGAVTTLVGTAGYIGSVDATGAAARFDNPSGITTDGINLYVADTDNNAIRKIVIATGEVTTLAIGFTSPQGIMYDGTDFYFSDSGNRVIRKMSMY